MALISIFLVLFLLRRGRRNIYHQYKIVFEQHLSHCIEVEMDDLAIFTYEYSEVSLEELDKAISLAKFKAGPTSVVGIHLPLSFKGLIN